MKKVEMYQSSRGNVPFEDWLMRLPESTQVRIFKYIKRVAAGGSKKNIKYLGDSIFEIKMNYASGYRVYFSELGNVIILLLLGGDKSTQKRDIITAKKYWRLYNEENEVL